MTKGTGRLHDAPQPLREYGRHATPSRKYAWARFSLYARHKIRPRQTSEVPESVRAASDPAARERSFALRKMAFW